MTCIFALIKNEHEYLEEWITYHLNLGIDHIFVFEDIDSLSHSLITDKFDKVTLNSVNILLNEIDKSKILYIKKTHNGNVQHIYIKNGLLYLKEKYDYDWCYVIDADEFISDKIELTSYAEYDAIILKWKCYGANGLINKPDYSQKGVIDTYTEEIKVNIPKSSLTELTKPCFNLNTYKTEFYFNNHYPSKYCKYLYLDNVYLKHYITRSWEEYVWKRTVRGYLCGKIRTFDFFFIVNPDMLYQKNKLLQQVNNRQLVVMPYKGRSTQGKEIELCLSLWRKYCTFDYHFVVIGDFDDQLIYKYKWVEFIKKEPLHYVDNQYNPHLDIVSKLEYVMDKYSKYYSSIIRIADDEYAIKPFSLEDITTVHYHKPIGKINIKDRIIWYTDKMKTEDLLVMENLPHINYTTHYPYYYEFDKLKEIINKYNMRNESYVLEDIYYNYYEHEEPVLDTNIRYSLLRKEDINKDEFNNALEDPNIKFINNSQLSWSIDLELRLQSIYCS